MPTLMDALRGGLSSVNTQPAPADESARLQEMMRAKTGRSIPGTSGVPRASNLQEQSAAATGADQTAQVIGAARVAQQGTEIAAQSAENARTQGLADASAARAEAKQRYTSKQSDLLQDLQQGRDGINLDRDKAKLEQLGFVTRLNSEKYTTELEQAGAENRLTDELAFKDATARAVFDDQLGAIEEKLKYGDLLNMDENQFRELMGSMQLDWAQSIAATKARGANQAATYTGLGNIVSTGASAYSTYDDKQNKGKPTQ